MLTLNRWSFRSAMSLLLAGALAFPMQVRAVDATSLPEFRDDPTFKTYLLGVGQGWLWANARLDFKHQPLLFCVPTSLKLDVENYLSLLDGKIRGARSQGKLNEKMPVELLLLMALEESFPCSHSPRP